MLLGAIETVHKEGLVHGGIAPKMIFVGLPTSTSKGGEREMGVKLAGTAWYQRLVDLNKSNPWIYTPEEEGLPEGWICPGALEEPFGYSKERDIWELGVVFAMMLFGLEVVRRYTTPMELIRDG